MKSKQMFLLLKILSLILLFLTSCGVDVYSDASPKQEFVALKVSTRDASGRSKVLKSECIDLNSPAESARITIHNRDELHQIEIEWIKSQDAFHVELHESGFFLHQESFAKSSFRAGKNASVEIDIDNVKYLIQLSGPFCS